MIQLGGDSQNTTPTAIQAGLQARQLAKPAMEAAKAGEKIAKDQFLQTVKSRTAANVPLADAMQSQSLFVRWAQKIPGLGKQITKFLGPDAVVNNAVGSLGKKGLGEASQLAVTKIMLEGGEDVAAKLAAAGVPQEAVEKLAQASAERTAMLAAKGVATGAATSAAANMSDDAIQAALNASKNGGMMAGKNVTSDAIKKVLAEGGDDVVGALRKLGLRADAAKSIAKEGLEAAGKAGATSAATTATAATTTEGTKSGLKGLFGKLFSGAKGNFIIAGIFSLGSNLIQLVQGKMNLKQFFALTGMDTLAYGAIGLGSAAAGGAIAGAIGQALIPIPGLGFILGLGIGLLGGMLYEKVLRNPVKNMLGGGAPPAANNTGYTPGQYNDPATGQPAAPTGQAVDPSTGLPLDPNAQQPGVAQNPAAPQTPAAPPPVPGEPQNAMSYEDALDYLNQLPTS